VIALSRKQAHFLQSPARTVIFRGGIRSGKTWVLCYKALEYALSGRRFCVVSFSYRTLADVVMWTMSEILTKYAPFEHKFKSTEKSCVIDGTEILFRSGDQPDTLRGLSLDGFGIDEAREFKDRSIYDVMIGRLSNSENPQGYITSSPKGKNWAFGLESLADTETIVQKTQENPFLPPSYIKALREAYTTQFGAQELDADIVDMGAGVISSKWFNVLHADPRSTKAVRFWDVAVTTKTASDYSAGAKCSMQDGKVIIHHIDRGRWEYPDLRRRIIARAIEDGQGVVIGIEEAGQQRAIIDDLKRAPELRGYVIRAIAPRGDKFARSMPWVSRAQLGAVSVVAGAWNTAFFDECDSFSGDMTHEHDDMIDGVSGAYQLLNAPMGQAHNIAF
jgi:predicted phage terminase large subunit-like protein